MQKSCNEGLANHIGPFQVPIYDINNHQGLGQDLSFLRVNLVSPAQRSVNNFGFLIGVLYGSSLNRKGK
jgi:hypothetical protein